jgi:3'-phosphoadenosine 5'-phosphosulfate sulfotransferase (PAPS reductase)/FAD synthetase
MDVWQYIDAEGIDMPSLYFSHSRNVVERDGVLLAESEFNSLMPGEEWSERTVRFRTIGDSTCTGGALRTRKRRQPDLLTSLRLGYLHPYVGTLH